eukprot:TRINITY_DN5784_c0_g1_i2.p3 TRINITY_DN5784_c0_g1~~TRINITY_DN5784_c0_g1_i2.p3  ORF type:complete len:139 (-),score=15.32 TRINITY_DN5784_c0_g1_i2:446-862(-)
MINEVEILKSLDHPNIIKIFDFYEDEFNYYVITEICYGGELFDKIMADQAFSEKKAASYIRQILSAISYCHANQIVHRDIKPENILLQRKEINSPIKIIDFGTSRQFQANSQMEQKFGNAYYIAPEVIKGKYSEKCDL